MTPAINTEMPAAAESVRTCSFAFTTPPLPSRLSKASSGFSWPAAPGRGGKLERPSSKLGDGGLGGGGGDAGVTLCATGRRGVSSTPELQTPGPTHAHQRKKRNRPRGTHQRSTHSELFVPLFPGNKNICPSDTSTFYKHL